MANEKITAASWFRNAAKSLGYTTANHFSNEVAPYTIGTIETNKYLINDAINKIKVVAKSDNKLREIFGERLDQAVKSGKEIASNTISDLKTGKFVNRERDLNSLSFGDDDFGEFGDFDFSFNDDDDSPDMNISLTSNINQNNPMVKAVQVQTDMENEIASQTAQRDISLATAQMENNAKLAGSIYTAIGVVNNNLGVLINFNNKTMAGYIGSSLKYYETALKHMETISADLKRVSSYFERMESANNQSNRSVDRLNVLGPSGELNLSDYGKMIKSNFSKYVVDSNAVLSSFKLMKSMSGGNSTSAMFSSPLRFIPEAITKMVVPVTISRLISSFDQTFQAFVPAMLSSLYDKGNKMTGSDSGTVKGAIKDFLSKTFGSVFGIQKGGNLKTISVDLSHYEKGNVPFDGVTRKSIVEVIPTYLRKILSAISNTDELIFNYDSGKFSTAKSIRTSHYNERIRSTNRQYEYSDKFKNAANTVGRTSDERAHYSNLVDTFFDQLTRNKDMFNPKKLETSLNKLLPGASALDKQFLSAIIKSLSKNQHMTMFGANHLSARNSMEDFYNTLSSDITGLSSLYNNANNGFTVNGKGGIGSDKYGKSPVDYLRDIKRILLEGIGVWIRQTPPEKVIKRRNKELRSSSMRRESGGTSATAADDPAPRRQQSSKLDPLTYERFYEVAQGSVNEYYYDEEDQKAHEAANKKLPKWMQKLRDKWFGTEENQNSVQKFFSKGFDKVAQKTTDFFNKVNNGLYDLVFGKDENSTSNGDPKKSILSRITDKMTGFYDWLKVNIFGKINDALFGDDGFFTKIKNSETWRKITEKGSKFGDWLFGTKEADSEKRSGGLFSDVANVFKDASNKFKLYITGVVKDRDGNVIERQSGSVFEEVSGIFNKFKDGIKNWFTEKKEARGKSGESIWDTITNSVKSGVTNFSNMFFGVHKNDKGEFESNIKSDEIIKTIKDRAPKSIAGGIVGLGVTSLIGAKGFGILGSMFLGPMSGVVIGTATAFLSQSDRFKNWLFGDDIGNGERAGGFISKSTQDFIKNNKNALIGGAALGYIKSTIGLGFLPSFIMGGPITGALTGLATSLLVRSETFKNFMFGKEDPSGQRVGGIISKMSDSISSTINKKGVIEKIGTISVGALGGAGLGLAISKMGWLGSLAFGPLGGAIAGVSLGLIAASSKWQERIFGKFDENGVKTKDGMFGELGTQMKSVMTDMKIKFTEWRFDVQNWFEQEVASPFADALLPFKEEFSRFGKNISNFFVNIGEKLHINDAIEGTKNAVVGFVKGFSNTFSLIVKETVKGTVGLIGTILSSPAKFLKGIAEGVLIPKHMKEGLSSLRGTIVENIKNTITGSAFYIKVFDPIKTTITDAFDVFKNAAKDSFKAITSFGKRMIKTLIRGTFKTLGIPFKLLGLGGRAIGKGIGALRDRAFKNADFNTLDDINYANLDKTGKRRGLLRSLGDLGRTFLPGSKLRAAAQFGDDGANYYDEYSEGKTQRAADNAYRSEARSRVTNGLKYFQNQKNEILGRKGLTIEERNRLLAENNDSINGLIDGADDIIFGKNGARKKDKLRSKFLISGEEELNKAIDDYNSKQYKNREKGFKKNYGKAWKKLSPVEKDKVRREDDILQSIKSIESSVNIVRDNTTSIKKYGAGTGENKDIQDKINDSLGINQSEKSAAESALSFLNDGTPESQSKRHWYSWFTDIWSDFGGDYDNTIKSAKKFISNFKRKPKQSTGNALATTNLQYAIDESLGMHRPQNIATSEYRHSMAQLLNERDENDSVLLDEGNSESKQDYLDFKTHGTTAAELRQKYGAEDAMNAKTSKFSKIMGALNRIGESTEKHKSIFDKIFGKKGVLTLAVLYGLPYLVKFLQNPADMFSSLVDKLIDGIRELLGLKDDDGNRTDVSDDSQTNNDAAAALVRGGGYVLSKGIRAGTKIAQSVINLKKRLAGETAESVMKQSTKESVETVGRNVVKNTADDTSSAILRQARKETAESILNQSAKESAETVGRNTVKNTADNVVTAAAKKGNKGLFAKFRELLINAVKKLLTKFSEKFPKMSGKITGLLGKMTQQASKLTDNVLKPFTAKITALFSRLGLDVSGAGILIGRAIDVAFVTGGLVSGATKAGAANLFKVPQSSVDGTMRTISSLFKGFVNFSWFFIIDIADDIIESVFDYSFLNLLASALYVVFKHNDEKALRDFKLAQEEFSTGYSDYTLAQQLAAGNVELDENGNPLTDAEGNIIYKDSSLVTESEGSYNDRINKSGLVKLGESIGKGFSTAKNFLFGNKGDETKYNEALAQKQRLEEAVANGTVDPNSEAYKLTMESINKSLKKNKSQKNILSKAWNATLGKTEIGSKIGNLVGSNSKAAMIGAALGVVGGPAGMAIGALAGAGVSAISKFLTTHKEKRWYTSDGSYYQSNGSTFDMYNANGDMINSGISADTFREICQSGILTSIEGEDVTVKVGLKTRVKEIMADVKNFFNSGADKAKQMYANATKRAEELFQSIADSDFGRKFKSTFMKHTEKVWYDSEGNYYMTSRSKNTYTKYNVNGDIIREDVDPDDVESLASKGLLTLGDRLVDGEAKTAIKEIQYKVKESWKAAKKTAKEGLDNFIKWLTGGSDSSSSGGGSSRGGYGGGFITNSYGSNAYGMPNTGGAVMDIRNTYTGPDSSGAYMYTRKNWDGKGTVYTHKGVDLNIGKNNPILSFTNGRVVEMKSGIAPDSGSLKQSGYGNYVKVQDENGCINVYGHMNGVNVHKNQEVKIGDKLGIEGHTGNSTGPHLHYEVRRTTDQSTHINPLEYLQQYDNSYGHKVNTSNISSGVDYGSLSSSSSGLLDSSYGTGLVGLNAKLAEIQSEMFSPFNNFINTISGISNSLYGTSGTSSSDESITGSTDAETIWNYLTKTMGLSPVAAAGIMGNLHAESGLKSNNLEGIYEQRLGRTDETYTSGVDNGSYKNFIYDQAGYGLAQWTYPSRKQNLYNYLKSKNLSIANLTGQLGFLGKELQESYSGTLNSLKSAPSVQVASNLFLKEFEKPKDQSWSVMKKRAEYGSKFYDMFKTSNTTDSTSDYSGHWFSPNAIADDSSITVESHTSGNDGSHAGDGRGRGGDGDIAVGSINRFANSNNYRSYTNHGGSYSTDVTVPDKLYEMVNKIIVYLSDIVKNTKTTSENISKSNVNIVNKTDVNKSSNNPIYSAATDSTDKKTVKNYSIAKSIAMGVQ